MELVPWKPFGELTSLRKEMENLWNRFLGESPFLRTFREDWLPPVDISETEDKLVIKAEMPEVRIIILTTSLVECPVSLNRSVDFLCRLFSDSLAQLPMQFHQSHPI